MRKLLPIWLLFCSVMGWAVVCPSGYSTTYFIQVPHQIFNSTQTDFPMPLTFNGASLAAQDGFASSITLPDLKDTGHGGKVQSSGNDIVFCDLSGNLLDYHRLPGYSGATGAAAFRYRISSASSTTDTVVKLLIGKAGDTDHSNPTGVYVNYAYYLNFGDGATLTTTDATSNGNNGTNSGGVAATGQISGGISFSLASQLVTLTGGPSAGAARHFEAWIKTSVTATTQVIHDQGVLSNGNRFVVDVNTSNVIDVGVQGPGFTDITGNIVVTDGIPHKVEVDIDGTGSTHLYVDGRLDGSANWAGLSTTATPEYLSQSIGGGLGLVGMFDEVKMSNVSRSADWVDSMYHCETSPNGCNLLLDGRTPSGLSAGANCVPVTIDHTKIPNTDRTNFQMLFRGRYPWLADITNGGYAVNGNSGHDIRWFSDSGCTSALTFERVSWTNTTGDSTFWVLLPTASHTVNSTAYVSVGNSAFTTDVSSATTFSSYGWTNRYHLGAPGSLGLTDSGSAGLNFNVTLGTVTGAVGPTGGAAYGAGSGALTWTVTGAMGSDHLGAHGVPVGTVHRTVESWVKLFPKSNGQANSFGHTGNIFGFGNGDVQTYQLGFAPTTAVDGSKIGTCIANPAWDGTDGTPPYCQAASQFNSPATPWLSPNNDFGWHKIVSVFPADGGTLNSILTYIDGRLATPAYTSGTGTSAVSTTDTVGATCGVPAIDNCSNIEFLGGAVTNESKLFGFGAEPGISTEALTADRIATDFNSQSSPFTFYSFAAATPPANPAVTLGGKVNLGGKVTVGP